MIAHWVNEPLRVKMPEKLPWEQTTFDMLKKQFKAPPYKKEIQEVKP